MLALNYKWSLIILVFVLLVGCKSNNYIYQNAKYSWYADRIIGDNQIAYAPDINNIISYNVSNKSNQRLLFNKWEKKNDISTYPIYTGVTNFETSLYNLSIDELINNIEKDSTLRTGALWAGVWTRDVSYSTILSLSYIVPEIAKKSLLCKVDKLGRIIQDTGTGGSWPCSCDRIVWSIAAWEIYKVTGDKNWLKHSFAVSERSINDDLSSIYDKNTGLFHGESSFIDWREQSYPLWMQPIDIYNSECLGTNALFYKAFEILANMSKILGYNEKNEEYSLYASRLKEAINKQLWIKDKHYYAQYLYGRNNTYRSDNSETLGESLAIIFDIASNSQAKEIMHSMPVSYYGPTIFWPQIDSIPNYHNNAIWPFVTAFWSKAAVKAGNSKAFVHALSSNIRAASLFATNQENFTSSTGEKTTVLNSHNMLWSLSGLIGSFVNSLIGLSVESDGIYFKPFVPKELKGKRELKNFKIRNMLLDISVIGYGNTIKTFKIDGVSKKSMLDFQTEGYHKIEIELNNKEIKCENINIQDYTVAPITPIVKLHNDTLKWNSVNRAKIYKVLKNGNDLCFIKDRCFLIKENGEYQIVAIDTSNIASFASEPVRYYKNSETIYKINTFLDNKQSSILNYEFTIEDSGYYLIDWLYSNGNDGIANGNSCSTRSLFLDNKVLGISVFPQRELNNWKNFGWNNSIHAYIEKGIHSISLEFLDNNINMNIENNSVFINSLRLTKL